MAPDLTAIKSALAELTDAELHALIAATNGVPPVVYGLLAWLDGACEWELNRRRGFDYPLQPPEAAIPPEEDAVSIDAAMAMRLAFLRDDPVEARGVLPLFDALVELLTGEDQSYQLRTASSGISTRLVSVVSRHPCSRWPEPRRREP